MQYDFIIAGAGCAGLSLLYQILQAPTLQDKKILVIDKELKNNNDRTWCFWEKEAGLFEEIVYKKWNTLEYFSPNFKKEFDLGAYTYKMIRGIDFYNFVFAAASKCSNVTFVKEHIIAINSNKKQAIVTSEKNNYTAKYVFNATSIFNPKITEENSLLQHFKGWIIKTETPFFNKNVGRLMDFRVSQKNGATFMYVLPTSTNKALIEYTLFSKQVLEKETYIYELKKYIKDTLQIDHYTIEHEEFGIIPMSLAKFDKNPSENIINIGTAGGGTKASSGYTFQFIQKNVAEIILKLKQQQYPVCNLSFREKMYQWYDATLIDVLISEKKTGEQVFTALFKKVAPEKIIAFLSNESSFLEDIAIMKSLPLLPFLSSGIKQLKR